MNTVLLQYALEVEKTGSISKAAANLYMDQPNLSKSIKTLEEIMGAPIFKRSSKGVIPTEKGKKFLEYARNILLQMEQMEALYQEEKKPENQIRLAIPRASYISEAFCNFVKKLDRTGEIRVWMKETNAAQAVREIEAGETDLAILRFQDASEAEYQQVLLDQDCEIMPVWESEYKVLMSKEHPLARKESFSLEELKQYPQIIHGDINHIEAVLSEKRIYVYERGSQQMLLNSNRDTYMWVSPIPDSVLEQYELVQRSCSNLHPIFKDVLIYKKGYQPGAWDRIFVEELEKELDVLNKRQDISSLYIK